jgi:hypothetical protein
MSDAFFDALAYLVVEWLDHETPLCLPTTRHPPVANAARLYRIESREPSWRATAGTRS